MKRNCRRITAIMIAITVVMAVSALYMFAALEMHHDCCGDGCPVCAVISAGRRLAETVLAAVSALAITFFALSMFTVRKMRKDHFVNKTPVLLKTTLLN